LIARNSPPQDGLLFGMFRFEEAGGRGKRGGKTKRKKGDLTLSG